MNIATFPTKNQFQNGEIHIFKTGKFISTDKFLDIIQQDCSTT